MLPEEQQRQIEAWLDGQLPVEELAAFEARLRGDPAFAAEVALHRYMRQAVREKDIGNFRLSVDTLLAEALTAGKSPPRPKVFQINRLIWAIAAALLLALAAVWFFRTSQPTLEQLYAEAFQPPAQFRYRDMPKDAVRDRDTILKHILPAWENLNNAWSEKKADEALQHALEIARTDTSLSRSQSAYYAAGIITLSEQKADEALEYLEKAGNVKPYAEDILWYKALAHVQIALRDPAHRSSAIDALNEVSRSNQPGYRHPLVEKMIEALATNNK